ncbi:hypothetical protein OSB04_013420 [Centaurea solstitialis]|uniref:F-box domain-containing protein n=1 Tax=Centaurea solstitialis TaxID=347529 RepID=A0AA38TNV3_9ASTR|nr:hypothetical protein OSB04_013420 [Centaurea solstitialis]
MAVELPDEVIVEILSMLPAKSLLRFQLVCKYWLNLISSSKFKLMHLHNFNQLNPRYFVRRRLKADDECYDVHLDDEAFSLDDSTQIEFPFDRIRVHSCFRIVGCCHGVVCLSDDGNCFSDSFDLVILWNPSIRRKLTLPIPIFEVSRFSESLVLGFGYDKMSDDYKLVRLVYTHYRKPRPRVEVYAVKTDIWRKVMFPDDLRCSYIDCSWSQVFSNGCVHWIASDSKQSHNSIMTFDTSTEVFGEIMLPDDLLEVEVSTMMLSLVGESLAVTYYDTLTNRARMASSTYKTWVMQEHKNPTSWKMIYDMHYPDVDMGKPLKLRNKGDMIMESSDRNIFVYNYYSGYACRIYPGNEPTVSCWTYVDNYQESLALLDVGHSVSGEVTKEALLNGITIPAPELSPCPQGGKK